MSDDPYKAPSVDSVGSDSTGGRSDLRPMLLGLIGIFVGIVVGCLTTLPVFLAMDKFVPRSPPAFMPIRYLVFGVGVFLGVSSAMLAMRRLNSRRAKTIGEELIDE